MTDPQLTAVPNPQLSAAPDPLPTAAPASPPTAAPDGPRAPRPVRLGIHGSPRLALDVVTAAGRTAREVDFVPYEVADPFRPLREGAADIMIVKYAPREPDIVLSRPVAHDGRAVIVGAHHPLAARGSVLVEEVAPYDAFRCPGDFPPEVWDQVVPPRTPAGTPLRRVHPMTTVAEMVRVLASGLAVHLSFRSLAAILPPHIKAVAVSDLPPAPVSFAWLRGTAPAPGVAAFVADAERAAERGTR